MSYDDPFKQIREMSMQFERINELTQGPFHELNEVLQRQQDLYSFQADRLAGILDEATAYRSLAQEAGDRLRSLSEVESAALTSLGTSMGEVAVGTTWLHQEAFYEAATNSWLDTLPLVFEDTAIKASLDALSLPDVAEIGPIKHLQDTLRAEILKIDMLSESIPALKFEEQLGLLTTKLETPQIASELLDFRERFQGVRSVDLLSKELLGNMRSLAGAMDLPYLSNATQQWTETLQSISTEVLGSERLIQSTFSAIANACSGLSAADPGPLVDEWRRLVEEEAERHERRELPSWLQGFLINLLFFLLSLIYSSRSAKENSDRLDDLESGQSAIIQTVEDDSEEAKVQQEAQELELAAIRQALEDLAKAVSGSESPPEPHLRIALTAVRLRSEPSTTGDVLLVIPKGFPVEIAEELGDWCRVQMMDFASGELAEGWVAKEYLREWGDLNE